MEPPHNPLSPAPLPAQPLGVSAHLPISTSRALCQPKPTRADSWLVVISFFTLRPLFFQGSRHCEVLRARVAHTPAGLTMEPPCTMQGSHWKIPLAHDTQHLQNDWIAGS